MKPFRLTAPVPSEHSEQARVISWSQSPHVRRLYPEAQNIFAIPNGSKRDVVTASLLKAEGVQRGIPDLYLPAACGGYHGMFLEMKKRTGGRLSEYQKVWISRLQSAGYAVAVCFGAAEAIKTIENYLSLKGKNNE